LRDLARLVKRKAKYGVECFREFMQPIKLPARRERIRINFNFHVEDIADTETYIAFREFVKGLADAAQAKPLLCVTTPHCPQTRCQMKQNHLCEEEYEERVKELARYSEIGYHGHFFSKKKGKLDGAVAEWIGDMLYSMAWADGLNPMGSSNFERAVVENQMREEIAWLKGIGIEPFAYVAGWWFMNEDVALLLEQNGIKIDFSVRQRHPDTFGGRYLQNGSLPPHGEPFILPPTKGVIEVRSVFYPVEHPRRSKEFFRDTVVHSPDSPLYVVFPSHEGEAIHFSRELMDNALATRRMKGIFEWQDLSTQLSEISSSLGLA